MAVEPPPRLLAELDRRGVAYQAGRVVIGTTRDYEREVRAALAATGVTLTLVANRASLMLLPLASAGHRRPPRDPHARAVRARRPASATPRTMRISSRPAGLPPAPATRWRS
jgi:hypothetical protein